MHSSKKNRTVALARHFSMYLTRKHTKMSSSEIGRVMGNKNNATVLLACKKIEELMKKNGELSWHGPTGNKISKARTVFAQLEKSIADNMNLKYTPPIFPTGSAYTSSDGWTPSVDEIKEFMQKSKELNLPGFNFWEWGNLHNYLPEEYYRTIRDFDWDSGGSSQKDIAEDLIAALNSHDINQIQELYQDDAVHITSERTVQGLEAIKSWFTTLFSDLLPNSKFTLAGFSGKGNTRQISWTANSSAGNVKNGSDTLGLKEGKIAYHFSDFSVIE
jgi:hypothetical protein